MRRALVFAVGAAVVAATAVAGGYDSQGFEPATFVPGPLNGQDGWIGYTDAGGLGMAPLVVTAPDPVLDTQAVRLEVPDIQGANSAIDHAVDLTSVVSAGGTITVSYDVYRQDAPLQNLWWWWWDAGEPTYGLQWDQGPATHPHGWNTGAGSAPTIQGRWANVTMTWDFGANLAYSWYDGVMVDNGIPVSGITEITGWTIMLGHDAADGTGADVAWIDNLYITPEPASVILLTLCALTLRRR